MALFGCDTFVVLPPLTAEGDIIFGKNSDRPRGEVQEVVYHPAKTYHAGEKLKCTYIEIDQALSTHAVLLSKPAWMWGAEMGANSYGVVIGNEAVWTVVDDETHTERLLGMDLLRLGLERSTSSSEAVSIISSLLEKHGQGGPCSDTDTSLFYHNSFLIADLKEAWVLETAGRMWAAEKITKGYRNISNCLSITTNISKKSDHLFSFAKEQKLWAGIGELSFKDVFSCGGCPREAAGRELLRELTAEKKFDIQKMFCILRDKSSTICRSADDPFHTSGSWVSVLSNKDIGRPPCHWITATPDPSVSLFKPFIFTQTPVSSPYIVSPTYTDDPAKVIPRFQYKVNREHKLYKLHKAAVQNKKTLDNLKVAEKTILEDVSKILLSIQNGTCDKKIQDELLKNAAETEVAVYSV